MFTARYERLRTRTFVLRTAACTRGETVHGDPAGVNFASTQDVLADPGGRQRSTGRRAARVSSRRVTLVRWGAVRTVWGSLRASSAMASMAATNSSSVALLSASVGSIMIAPRTTSGKAIVSG